MAGFAAVVIPVSFAVVAAMLMELLGAVGTFEFMALTGGTDKGEGRQQQEKAFHGRAV